VCLNAEGGLDLDTQRALFTAALDVIERRALDLVNKALELFWSEDATLEYSIYDLPPTGQEGVESIFTGTLDFQPYMEKVARGEI